MNPRSAKAGCNHFGAAVVPVLAHLGDKYMRRMAELLADFADPRSASRGILDRAVGLAKDAGDDPRDRVIAAEGLLNCARNLADSVARARAASIAAASRLPLFEASNFFEYCQRLVAGGRVAEVRTCFNRAICDARTLALSMLRMSTGGSSAEAETC